MRIRLFLMLVALPFVLCSVLGCGGSDAPVKPKVVKGGVDPEKAKADQSMKMEIMK